MIGTYYLLCKCSQRELPRLLGEKIYILYIVNTLLYLKTKQTNISEGQVTHK